MYANCSFTNAAATELTMPGAVPGPDTEGVVETIETCGAVDGPGLRYVVFTRGCPLRCQYCHNPETQGKPKGDITTAEKVLADVKRYKAFIKRGGLTISGGEPLMQADFVHAIFKGAKEAGIHTALDTSGFLGARASDELLKHVDLVLLDIKSGLSSTYKNVTGVQLSPTLDFAQRLDALGKSMWIRFVLVPGLTDSERNIEAVAKFVATLKHVDRVEILPFHKMGEHKYEHTGLTYNLSNTPTPTREQVETARAIFARHGVEAR
ncbi:pyruvate formate-lyase-activating protein [Cerasicoccus frondis]|uniref:pyruvate formate-lyase-activating protein n=1 Tax=Cerasicoccus frondis TaxID=490090 RepID=UPI0028528620|nr:pyruvate formate-lyase-activating protein [Cerasicoccus frondis]